MKIYNLEPLGVLAVVSLYRMSYCTFSTSTPIKNKINFLRDIDYNRPFCQLIEEEYEETTYLRGKSAGEIFIESI